MTMETSITTKTDPAGIAGPNEDEFRASFGCITPPVSFVDTSLGRIAYYLLNESNRKKQSPIVLVHGVCTPAVGMLLIARELQKQNSSNVILLFDLWGHGMSSSPSAAHTLDVAHQQLVDLLDHLQWKQIDLVGYSLGGSIAATFTAAHKEYVRSVFLIAPVGLLRLEDVAGQIEPDDTIEKQRSPEEAAGSQRRILDWLEGAPTIVVPDDWKEQVKKGILVAPALRKWQQENHHGHIYSILSYFRNGNVFGRDKNFIELSKRGDYVGSVIAGQDEYSKVSRLEDCGIKNSNYVLPFATHGLARDDAPQVVYHYMEFLKKIQ